MRNPDTPRSSSGRTACFSSSLTFPEVVQDDLGLADEGIATNILTDRLVRLETFEIITKRPDPDSGRQFIYLLTEKGIALIPLLVELVCWGAIYDEAPDADPEAVRRIAQDKQRFIRKLEKGCRD